MAWNSWLTIRTLPNQQNEIEEDVSNPDTMVVNHTINGYTTDITETVAKVQSRIVSVLVTIEDRTSTGSGVIYRANGNDCYILTSYNVIQNADKVEVRFDSGFNMDAEVVGTDEKTDVALLLVHPEFQTEPIVLGTAEVVKQGEYVIALGGRNPSTGSGTVGFGVVSFPAQVYREYAEEEVGWIASTLFTDIYAVDSSSGGPLVNLNGDMIGLITRRATTSDSSPRLATAISSDEVQIVIDELLDGGSVTRGFIGVVGRDVEKMELYEKSAYNLMLDNYDGVLITQVVEESPALVGGLQIGDIITQINDTEIHNLADLRQLTYTIQGGDTLSVQVNREGRTETVSVIAQ